MRRRALLATAATTLPALAAGCLGAAFSGGGNQAGRAVTPRLEMTTIADGKLPAQVLYTVGTGATGADEAELFDDVVDGGATTTARQPQFPTERPIAFRDGVYDLAYEVTDETPATTYSVKVDVVTDSVDESEAIRFEDLPDVDKEAFASRGLADGDPVGVGTTLLYTETEREQSVLVPESEYAYITWADGTEAEWVVDDASATTVYTYRYTADHLMTTTEYGREMRERFAFELSGLPAEQRAIVETAIEDGQYVAGADETPSDAFAGLADRFRDREQAHALDEPAPDRLSGEYLVRYQGQVFWTELFVREDASTGE